MRLTFSKESVPRKLDRFAFIQEVTLPELKTILSCWSQLSSLYEWASLRVAVPYPRQGETEARKHLRKPDTNRVLWGHSKLWKIV